MTGKSLIAGGKSNSSINALMILNQGHQPLFLPGFLPLFSSMGQVLNSILSRAQKMIENLVPHIQAACRKLISAVLFAGRYEGIGLVLNLHSLKKIKLNN